MVSFLINPIFGQYCYRSKVEQESKSQTSSMHSRAGCLAVAEHRNSSMNLNQPSIGENGQDKTYPSTKHFPNV